MGCRPRLAFALELDRSLRGDHGFGAPRFAKATVTADVVVCGP
jgi:hypothetical protein